MEFTIGQIFTEMYPQEAAAWCNEQGNCFIEEIEPEDGVRRFEIKEIPAETEEQKRQRMDLLSLSKREVFLALYHTKGITPDKIKEQITDPAALIEFEYANDYYRGNPLITLIGAKLGFTSDDLDYLFQNKKLPEVQND